MLTGLSDHILIPVARKLIKKRFNPLVGERESPRVPKYKQENFKSAVQQIE